MKTVKIKIAGALLQQETGPEAQVGDQVKLYLDQIGRPELPEFVFGVIQHPIDKVGCCDDSTLYSIEYDEDDIPQGLLRPQDVVSAEVTSAVDIVAQDLQEEIARATAAEETETAARIAADALLAPKASPVFTGNPTAPTPATSDNDTSLATTAFVKAQGYAPLASPAFTGVPTVPLALDSPNNQIASTLYVYGEVLELKTYTDLEKAPKASPTFTGDPKAPTPSTGDNDTSIATTAFVKAQNYATLAAPALTGAVTIDGEVPLRITSAPSTYGDAGSLGDVAYDSTYFYYYAGTRWERIEKDSTWV